MAGAGFAAGFFGEATNIMRERSKNKREDELIAEERKQKDADWARQTTHDVDMATLNYTLTTKAARDKKVEAATAALDMYKAAGGDPTLIAKMVASDPDAAIAHIDRALAIKDKNGLNRDAFYDLTTTVGVDNITEDTATQYQTGIGSGEASAEAAFNAYAMEDRVPAAPMKKEEMDLVSTRLTAAALETASRRAEAINAAGRSTEYSKMSRQIEEADKYNSSGSLLKDVGVKVMYDTMTNMGQAGYDIRRHPDVIGNPAAAAQAQTIAGIERFMEEDVTSPYEAADVFAEKYKTFAPEKKFKALQDFVRVFSVDFLPDDLLVEYYSFLPPTPENQ